MDGGRRESTFFIICVDFQAKERNCVKSKLKKREGEDIT